MSTVIPTTPEVSEQKFAELAASLATLDTEARAKGADASAVRAQRANVATLTIRAAVNEGVSPEGVRIDLLNAGVLKGTVSKIVTVLNAINGGILSLGDVKSLNQAYSLITNSRKGVPNPGVKEVKVEVIKEVKVEAKYTQKGAIDYFVALINDEPDVDKALKMTGDFITKFTNALTRASKEKIANESAGE